MGKTALFAIAAFSVFSGYYSISSQQGLLSTNGLISDYQHEVIARNAAMTGYNRAKQQLAEDFTDLTPISGLNEEASYSVKIYEEGSLREVRSEGQVFSHDDGIMDYKIFAKFREVVFNEVADEPPEFMQYALLSDDDLTLGGNLTVDTVKVEDHEATVLNANVHTNGTLKANGKKAQIKGFGSYKIGEEVTHENIFRPYNNPARENVIEQVFEGVEIPASSFDGDVLAIKAQSTTLPGLYQKTVGNETIFSEVIDFEAMGSTRENPYIWHVTGDLEISGDTRFIGYVLFIVNGDINIRGNVKQGTHKHGSENNTALYAGDDVNITGTSDLLWGQIFAKDQVVLGGNTKVHGNVTAGGNIDVQGTPTRKYYPASPALTTIWQDPEMTLPHVQGSGF